MRARSGRTRRVASRAAPDTHGLDGRAEPTENNLSGADVAIPLGVLVGVCGVSGSGKSSLVVDAVGARPRTAAADDVGRLRRRRTRRPRGDRRRARAAVVADQSRAGIRSPGAFLGVQRALRRAYAQSDEAVARDVREEDLAPRCDACHGRGAVREDMGFLPALERPCDACEATGYGADVREIAVRGRTLPELDALTLDEVLELWGDLPPVARSLEAACALGLGYLVLAQRSTSLSGGEAQRLKLTLELAKLAPEPTLYILDEPTVGLHARDVALLVDSLDRLVEAGHSVLVVEHDPTLLACCDRLIELGPGGGPDGGRVIAEGTPEQLARSRTPTAPYLRAVLG